MGVAKKLMWGVASGMTSKAVRAATRRAMHNGYGAPRLPVRARTRSGLGTALLWAAGAGAFLALADVLKEQRKDATQRA